MRDFIASVIAAGLLNLSLLTVAAQDACGELMNSSNLVAELNFTDEGSGLATMQFSYDKGVTWEATLPYTAIYELDVQDNGIYYITVKICDAAGNCTVSQPVKVEIDETPPGGEMVLHLSIHTRRE